MKTLRLSIIISVVIVSSVVLFEVSKMPTYDHPNLITNVHTNLITNDELERIHTLCNDPIISTNGSDTLITCLIPANVTSWLDIAPTVNKRTTCTGTVGCSC